MSTATKAAPISSTVWNVPNQITMARLALSVVLFALMHVGGVYGGNWFMASFVVFIVAASTDWIDGYWARKYGQVTVLGRVMDPFADKIIICGTFIFLASLTHLGSGVTAWMAVVVVGRELLVTALRSFLEGEGADFSAVMSGKLKMLLQCIAAGVSLFALTYPTIEARPEWLRLLLIASVWAAVLLTVYSGIAYVKRAVALMSTK